MPPNLRTPFDSLCLAAVTHELQALMGARVQRLVQLDDLTIALELYKGSDAWLLLSADAAFARAHLIARRPDGIRPLPPFGLAVRRALSDARLVLARQRGLDRILELGFSSPEGDHMIVAELMGKHSNLMLVDADRKVRAAAKWVGPSQSARTIRPGGAYEPPPLPVQPSLLKAQPGDDLSQFEGASPFLRKLIAAGTPLQEIQSAIRTQTWAPVFVEGMGAYPLPLDALGGIGYPRPSLSSALEQHFVGLADQARLANARNALLAPLKRVLMAREVAMADLEQAIQTAHDAPRLQQYGEFILAYQGQIKPGDAKLEAWDYAGEPIAVPLKPDLSPKENSQRYFDRAKRAKARVGEVAEQRDRLARDHAAIQEMMERVEAATRLDDFAELRAEAEKRRWLNIPVTGKSKEERPFAGHAVKELLSPGGFRVLYGTNATSNDYVTTQVAKSNDYWLHVRGQTSTHVVLQTAGKPERVQRADLEFAALVAARNSIAKHAKHVPVDYTLKKYVRKPRGSAAGFATYEREKTLYVDP